MGLTLKVERVTVFTNLLVRLNSRTTKEEANKEVERMLETKNLFQDYEWKIEGCDDGGIRDFSDELRDAIIERIEEEGTEDVIDWDGFNPGYEVCVAHIPVETDLQVALKSASLEEAVDEVQKACAEKKWFEGYEWSIADCDDPGINTFDEPLQQGIIDRINEHPNLKDCIS